MLIASGNAGGCGKSDTLVVRLKHDIIFQSPNVERLLNWGFILEEIILAYVAMASWIALVFGAFANV